MTLCRCHHLICFCLTSIYVGAQAKSYGEQTPEKLKCSIYIATCADHAATRMFQVYPSIYLSFWSHAGSTAKSTGTTSFFNLIQTIWVSIFKVQIGLWFPQNPQNQEEKPGPVGSQKKLLIWDILAHPPSRAILPKFNWSYPSILPPLITQSFRTFSFGSEIWRHRGSEHR